MGMRSLRAQHALRSTSERATHFKLSHYQRPALRTNAVNRRSTMNPQAPHMKLFSTNTATSAQNGSAPGMCSSMIQQGWERNSKRTPESLEINDASERGRSKLSTPVSN